MRQRIGSRGSRLSSETEGQNTKLNLLEKEKAAAGAVQWSPETGGSLLRQRLGIFMVALTLD
jgi:hypothetical protein